ncbi:MAG: 3-hydroxyacyl-ACP dehydratase FabZ family protein [Phycisphaeraceae bacterium]|nr:3-hydroxyacyl-ACP dehydratase FabZ family protein [Phycisphaeraceae bacterium]
MRWIWIDRILELEREQRCVAVKNVSLAEDVLHDHFAATDSHDAQPVMPNTLIVEGFAQTAGILVGHAGDFAEKVILAKISRARFSDVARPGDRLRYEAIIERLDESGAATEGTVTIDRPGETESRPLAEISMMFSHVDHNRAGTEFPKENFVFTDQFMGLLERSGFGPESASA